MNPDIDIQKKLRKFEFPKPEKLVEELLPDDIPDMHGIKQLKNDFSPSIKRNTKENLLKNLDVVISNYKDGLANFKETESKIPKKLVFANNTRWTTRGRFYKSVLENKDNLLEFKDYLKNQKKEDQHHGEIIENFDWELIEDLKNLFNFLNIYVNKFQAQNYCIGELYLDLASIRHEIEYMQAPEDDFNEERETNKVTTILGKNVVKEMIETINSMHDKYFKNKAFLLATLFNPESKDAVLVKKEYSNGDLKAYYKKYLEFFYQEEIKKSQANPEKIKSTLNQTDQKSNTQFDSGIENRFLGVDVSKHPPLKEENTVQAIGPVIQQHINSMDIWMNTPKTEILLCNTIDETIELYIGEPAQALFKMPISAAQIERTFSFQQRFCTKDKNRISSSGIEARSIFYNGFGYEKF